LNHLAHAACNVFFLLAYVRWNMKKLDDRPGEECETTYIVSHGMGVDEVKGVVQSRIPRRPSVDTMNEVYEVPPK